MHSGSLNTILFAYSFTCIKLNVAGKLCYDMSVATVCNRCCTIQGEENETPKGLDVHTVQRS